MKIFIRFLSNFIFCFGLTLVFAVYFLFFINLRLERENQRKGIRVFVILKSELTAENIGQLGEKLRKEEKIREVTYTSKENALKELQNEPAIVQGVTLLKENPLPASFTVYPRNYGEKEILEISAFLSTLPGVEKIITHEEILKKYRHLDEMVKTLEFLNFILLGVIFGFALLAAVHLFFVSRGKILITPYLGQMLAALLGTGGGLYFLYQLKLRSQSAGVFFTPNEIIFFFLGALILSLSAYLLAGFENA